MYIYSLHNIYSLKFQEYTTLEKGTIHVSNTVVQCPVGLKQKVAITLLIEYLLQIIVLPVS